MRELSYGLMTGVVGGAVFVCVLCALALLLAQDL